MDCFSCRLGWYGTGPKILLGVARGLAYLHDRKVCVPELKPIAVFGRCCTRADLLRYPCPACQKKGTMQSPCHLIKSSEYVYVMLPGVVIHTHVVLIFEFYWTNIEHADAINF